MIMNSSELMLIIRVIGRLEDHFILEINVLDLITSLKRFEILNNDLYISLLGKCTRQENSTVDRKRKFYYLMTTVLPLLSLDDFLAVLDDAGYHILSRVITAERNGVSRHWPPKRELPHADEVNEYFTNLKRCADNNSFQDGTQYRLESFVSQLDEKIKHCKENPGRFQLLVDKRIMLYFLLAQQFSSMHKRLEIMKRMRDSVPQNVDRTYFNTIFHSYMTVIWSIKDDVTTADSHEQQARCASQLCLPGLVSIVLRLCVQYKNNIFYFRRHHSEDLEHATLDFEEVFQMFDYLRDDPQLYGTIAMLEMVHTLLGIDWDLHVCNIDNIKQRNIERGKTILSTLRKPSETRRKMLYYLCRARLHETLDIRKAQKYARKSLHLAEDGCYYDVEKTNIQTYLDTLSANILPQPHI